MIVKMKVGDLECEASTDFMPITTLGNEDKMRIYAGIFNALKAELRNIATKYIEANSKKGETND